MRKHFAVLLLVLLAVCPLASAQEEPPDDPPPGPQADLSVLKTGPAEAAPNSQVTYTVTVHNFGPDPALAATLTDNYDGLVFVSATPPAGFTCTPDDEDPIVSCGGSSIAVNTTVTFTFVFQIPDEALPGDTFVNFASAATQTNDPNPENNASSVPTTVPSSSADVGVTKSGPSSAGPGTTVTWTIVVRNIGPATANNVVLSDTLPAGTTFAGLTQSGGFTCTTPAVGAGGTITCQADTMAPGATTTFTLTAIIASGTDAGTEIANTAVVTADNNVNEENDSSTSSLIVSSSNASVTKSGPATANAGSTVPYTITVGNAGPNDALDVVLTDAIPPGTTFVSLTHTSGLVASICTVNGTVSCNFPVIEPGQTSTYTLTLRAGDTTLISNTANVTSSNFDSSLANNSSTALTIVTPLADVAVTKTGPAAATAGTNATYVVTVTNQGPSTATDVSLVDTPPPGTTFVSLTQSGPAFTCTPAATTVTCTRSTLAPLAATTFNITVAIPPSATGTITNTAVVSTTTADPNSANNSASAPTNVTASADLAVTKSGPVTATAGTNVTYTITLTNLGPSTAANVSLVDTFPAGTTFVSHAQPTGPTFACVASATTLTCTRATLDPAAPATFQLTVAIPVNTPPGSITNSVSVTSTTPDPVPANNTASALTGVGIAPADLSIAKTVNAPEVLAGSSVIFTLLVQNAGPGVAENVVVTDVLPPGTTLHSAPGCTGTTTLTCNVGTLAAGSSTTFTLTVTLPSTPGPVTNTATVTSSTPDPTPNNNAGTVTVQAVAPAPAIPTVSEWGLLLMALALAALMFFRTR